MALSGILMLFLAQHFSLILLRYLVLILLIYCPILWVTTLVQYVIQPILIVGVIFHFIMGFVLDYKNRKARPIAYVKIISNSSWFSRNMILSGSVILAFWDCIL
jgi:succinate dehydrogenase / fumarate reductase cytochrome b subunit